MPAAIALGNEVASGIIFHADAAAIRRDLAAHAAKIVIAAAGTVIAGISHASNVILAVIGRGGNGLASYALAEHPAQAVIAIGRDRAQGIGRLHQVAYRIVAELLCRTIRIGELSQIANRVIVQAQAVAQRVGWIMNLPATLPAHGVIAEADAVAQAIGNRGDIATAVGEADCAVTRQAHAEQPAGRVVAVRGNQVACGAREYIASEVIGQSGDQPSDVGDGARLAQGRVVAIGGSLIARIGHGVQLATIRPLTGIIVIPGQGEGIIHIRARTIHSQQLAHGVVGVAGGLTDRIGAGIPVPGPAEQVALGVVAIGGHHLLARVVHRRNADARRLVIGRVGRGGGAGKRCARCLGCRETVTLRIIRVLRGNAVRENRINKMTFTVVCVGSRVT